MTGNATRQALAAVLLGAAMLAQVIPADAASSVCRQLQAELAGTSGGRGQPKLAAKYDSAIERQRGEIAKARGQSRRAGCFFSLFGNNVAQCATLNAAIQRMNGNLDKLQAKRAKLAGGAASGDRRRILAKLDANGCNDAKPANKPVVANASRDRDTTSILRPLLDDDEGDDNDGRVKLVINQRPGNVIQIPPPLQATGEFRTMCVRTCDGYFFPMSNAATLGDFERDQKNCESSCPGTEMQVFYSRGLDENSADMTSAASGQPYSKLPTAYLYKRTDMSAPQCGCRAAEEFSIIGGAHAAVAGTAGNASAVSSSIVSFPAPPPPKPADTEAGDDAPIPEAPEIPLTEQQRNVRVVGPKFLPDPAGAIDLQAPARTTLP